jgi:hypothetical protein
VAPSASFAAKIWSLHAVPHGLAMYTLQMKTDRIVQSPKNAELNTGHRLSNGPASPKEIECLRNYTNSLAPSV